MYAVKPGVDMVSYTVSDGTKIHTSRQPAEVANELIRRSDSYKDDGVTLAIDGGISYWLCDLERLVA